MEEHVTEVFGAVKSGGRAENAILIFKINTPGGLVASMSEITSMIAESDCPVVMWVAPSGASAASAGAFIVEASHVAAMAPGTNIGAAHPVTGSGGDIEDGDMREKIMNDLKSKMRAFTQERGRNVAVAESMITKSVSLSAREALDKKVVEIIAADEEELLSKLNGREVSVKGKVRKLATEDYETRNLDMSFRLRALEILSRPDIAYLALLAGIFLIILEAKAPGGFVMGTAGALLLLAASYGMRVLPVNWVGAALLIGGVAIIILDVVFGGIGLFAAIGVAAMFFGGLLLFKAPGGELLNVSTAFIAGVTAVIAVIFLLVLTAVCRALKRKPAMGEASMKGERGKICAESGGAYTVALHGEYWKAVRENERYELNIGDEVEVVCAKSLLLYVKPADKNAQS